MLHPHARAQRRAATRRPPRRRLSQPSSQLNLSVTLGTLPATDPLKCIEIRPGHWLVIVRDGADYDEVAFAYVHGDRCPAWIARRMYGIYGLPSPLVDPRRYFLGRWWESDWPVSVASISLLEGIGGDLIYPWQHDWLT
ncbi:hypothetical protein [Nocardiopsis dassonvillei]|uniref:hypothetical protein n=1 Tax=Nocardiopsis dassonvillei TaxID=2014 RepID=UPI003631B149